MPGAHLPNPGSLLFGGRTCHTIAAAELNTTQSMTPSRAIQAKTYLLLILIVLFSAAGNTLLGKGMKQIGQVSNYSPWALTAVFMKVFINGWIWLGIGNLLLFLGCLMLVLSWADYSFVMPAVAVSYALAPIMSHFLLRESVTPTRWAGVGFICLGVLLVTRTPASTTKRG